MMHPNPFSIGQLVQLEIGREGNIMPRLRDLDYDNTLQGSLLTQLYPNIKVASVLVPLEPLDEMQEARVRRTMANFVYKEVRYRLVGAASSAKKGLFYFADEDHWLRIAERFLHSPQGAITYFGTLVSTCRKLVQLPRARVLFVKDGKLGTNDCGAWIRESIAVTELRLSPSSFSQFRLAWDKKQAKGSFKVMPDAVADLLDADVILPKSCIKPASDRFLEELVDKAYEIFSFGKRFRGPIAIGIREEARAIEFESSYTLTQYAPAQSILEEIAKPTEEKITAVNDAVHKGNYETLLELIGHHPTKRPNPKEEVGPVVAALLADKTGHIVKHPWINRQVDKLLARWAFKACTGGAYHLPGFALAHDGYLFAVDGKIYHGSDWIPENKSICPLSSKRGLCVRFPIRMYEDLLPVEHMSSDEVLERLREDLEQQGCTTSAATVEQIAATQLRMAGTYILHSKTAAQNGGDFDFDLVGAIEEDRFPIWVEDRFALTNPRVITKTRVNKQNHAWWNIVHVAREAVGNQIGVITDLITSCIADGRPELAEELVRELQNALDSLKWGVAPDQKKISAIRQQVDPAPWLRYKDERRVSDLPADFPKKDTDKIRILYNYVRPCFFSKLTETEPLDAFMGLIETEEITDKMIEQCHQVKSAYGAVVAGIAERKAVLKAKLDAARKDWEVVQKDPDKNVRREKRFARTQAQAAYRYNEERSADEMKAIMTFLKIWTQNKTKNRMAWAQCLNSMVCDVKDSKSTGSLIWSTFAQELVDRIAEHSGGPKIRLFQPRLIEGFIRTDQHGRTFLVEVIKNNLKETFLFSCKDGNYSLDDTIPVVEAQSQEQAEGSTPAEAPSQTEPIQDPEGLGHELLEEAVAGAECLSDECGNEEPVPF